MQKSHSPIFEDIELCTSPCSSCKDEAGSNNGLDQNSHFML